MVLAELGNKIKDVLGKINGAEVVDKKLLDEVLNSLGIALMKADVNLRQVAKLQSNIRAKFPDIEEKSGDKRLQVKRLVVNELQGMLSTEKKPYEMKKNKQNIIMFVGLQGSGKTTTCTKYANYYQKKGFKVGLVCADTFRAGAYDQLKQNATKCRIHFYGSYTETDPVKIAEEGVQHFKKLNFQLIIVDTSGRHKQEDSLFEEMKQVATAIVPDDVVFIMDSHIGQACYDQAIAFKKCVDVGSVIITKLDGHAKGGGALSAVAATESPITFIGTGEHFEDFESFDPQSFIKELLGLGNLKGLFNKVKEVVDPEKHKKLAENLQKGVFTIRDMRDQYSSILKMGPLDKVVSMIPGLGNNILPKGKEKDAQAKIKRFMCMMDSMNDKELDGKAKLNESRMLRIARGCGCLPNDVADFIEEYNRFYKMVEKMGKISKGGNMAELSRNPGQMASKLGNVVPQNVLNQLGGTANLMNMMKDMSKMEGMEEFANMAKSMGAGGAGGKPRRKR